MKLNLFLLMFAVVGLIGCNKPTSSNESGAPNVPFKVNQYVYPHKADFLQTHSELFQTERAQCMSCHGYDFQGGSAKVSCYSCHNYPHPPGFALAKNHGAKFLEQKDKPTCFKCHVTAAASEGRPEPQCAQCHAAFPHSEDFKGGMGNHPDLAKTYAGKCLVCHANMKKNMPNNPKGCLECHDGGIVIGWGKVAEEKKPDDKKDGKKDDGREPQSQGKAKKLRKSVKKN